MDKCVHSPVMFFISLLYYPHVYLGTSYGCSFAYLNFVQVTMCCSVSWSELMILELILMVAIQGMSEPIMATTCCLGNQ